MPNWCINKLIVTGPDIPSLLKKIGTQDKVFSFDQIIEMPKADQINDGTDRYYAITAAIKASPEKFDEILEKIKPYESEFNSRRVPLSSIISDLENETMRTVLYENIDKALLQGIPLSDFYKGLAPDQNHNVTFPELVEIGNLCLENLIKYGVFTGYFWRLHNWGTKWDLNNSTHIVRQYDNILILKFNTAWTPPLSVIVEMGLIFPEYKFRLTWYEPGAELQGQLDVFGEEFVYKPNEKFPDRFLYHDLSNIDIPASLRWESGKN